MASLEIITRTLERKMPVIFSKDSARHELVPKLLYNKIILYEKSKKKSPYMR